MLLRLIAAVLFVTAVLPWSVGAAPAEHRLTVAPSTSDIALDPGESETLKLTIANQGTRDFTLSSEVTPYSVADYSYEADFDSVDGAVPVQDWLSVRSIPSRLDAGDYTDASITINVPEGVEPGGYAAALLVDSKLIGESASGVQPVNRIAHLIYITVNGPITRQTDVELNSTSFLTFNPQQVTRAVASNSGGSYERAKVELAISDIFGRPVAGEEIERYVLAGTKRTFEVAWSTNSWFGVYRIDMEATVAQNRTTSANRWMMYIHPIIVMIAVGLIAGSLAYRYARRSRSHGRSR